jgi:hypothetical protein
MGAVTIDSLEIKLTTSGSKGKSALNGLSTSMNRLGKSSGNATLGFSNFVAKIGVATVAVKKIGRVIGASIKEVNDYIENMNLFNVAMGRYAEEAGAYAEKVQSVLGVDVSEFIRNQGVFMTLASGFGVAGDRAKVMSQNLTQLGYDISSFFNISTGDAMQKLQSGLSGELEPLRRLGYDLSQAKLEATAAELGITKNITAMTQAEKAQLRYYAIMNQVTTAHGDMARTIETPANQLRILTSQFTRTSRAIGSIFIPAVTAILPYVNALLRVIEKLASSIAGLFGYEAPKFENLGVDGLASGADDAAEGLEDATKAAKKLKSYTMGFDELNIIDPNSGSSGKDDGSGGGWADFELPEYDFLGDADGGKIAQIVDNLNEKLRNTIVITEELQLALDSIGTDKEIPISIGMVTESVVLTAQNIFFTMMDYLNGLLYNTDWSGIGSTISSCLSNALTLIDYSGIYLRLGEFGLGVIIAIYELIAGAISGVDWGGVLDHLVTEFGEILKGVADLDWEGLSNAYIGLSKSLFKAILSVNWRELGNKIGELLRTALSSLFKTIGKFDWEGIAISMFTALGGAIAGLTNLAIGIVESIWDLIVDAYNGLKGYFGEKLQGSGEDIAKGIFHGICDAFSNIGTWIMDNIFTPFMDGFKAVFGIHSPSTVMAEQGDFLVEGFLQGITDSWGTIVEFFSEKWESLKKGMSNTWENIKTDASEKWDSIKTTVSEKWTGMKTSATDIFTGLKDGVVGIWDSMWTNIKNVINSIIGGIEFLANGVIKGVNLIFKALNNLQIDVPDWVTDLTGVDSFGFNFKMLKEIKIPRFAEGGFPETGELFVAREAGAEMVGSIGGRTAVANNDQIVAGIANGVAEANSEQNYLLREQNELLRALLAKDTSVNLDGRRLSKELGRVNRGMGATIITGGAY